MMKAVSDDLRINELDLTRAGIISVQQSALDEQNWQAEFEAGEVTYKVQGYAPRGRPFGVDADILLGLQTLFFRAGCPDSNRIRVMPLTLIQLAGMRRSGPQYVRMREALMRLSVVRWEMRSMRGRQGQTVTTGLISDLRLDDHAGLAEGSAVGLTEDGAIDVVFTLAFADSIRSGLYQMLDANLMQRLGSSSSRSLYRVIQAHRLRADDSLASDLEVTLRDWALACGFSLGRTDAIMRTLDQAHERLVEAGYLEGVEVTGRGLERTLRYTFAATQSDPELVTLLTQRGIRAPAAQLLAAEYPGRVRTAAAMLQTRMSEGWQPRSVPSALADMIRKPEKYGLAEPALPSPAQTPARGSRKAPSRLPKMEDGEDAALDSRTALMSLLKVKLKRSPSPMALEAVQALSDEGVLALRAALNRPAAEGLQLAQTILNAPL